MNRRNVGFFIIIFCAFASLFIILYQGWLLGCARCRIEKMTQVIKDQIDEKHQLRMEIKWLKCEVQSEALRPVAPIEVDGPTLLEQEQL